MLPAIPDEWDSGAVHGIVCRGGFVVDFAWSGGKVTEMYVHSNCGNKCSIVGSVKIEGAAYYEENGVTSFETEAGKTYAVNF